MMLRAWGGNYGFDGMGISASGTEIAPSRQIAFKEAWAEFVARVVFPAQRGCQLPSCDDNGDPTGCKAARDTLAALEQQRTRQLAILPSLQGAGLAAAREKLAHLTVQIAAQQLALDECQLSQPTTTLPGPLSEGAQWRDNVAKALCDWYDQRADDDLRLPGPGDHFAITDIHTMWRDLMDMKANASSYSSSVIGPGLWFCDFVTYYLNVRQSAAVVGAATHDKQKILVRNLLSNNNIACPATAS